MVNWKGHSVLSTTGESVDSRKRGGVNPLLRGPASQPVLRTGTETAHAPPAALRGKRQGHGATKPTGKSIFKRHSSTCRGRENHGNECPLLSAARRWPRELLTLPRHTDRTQSVTCPVSSLKARHRLSSWSHSLTAPPSFDLMTQTKKKRKVFIIGYYK